MYYVSGVRYVTKECDKKALQEKSKTKSRYQPIMKSERSTINVVMKNQKTKTEKKRIASQASEQKSKSANKYKAKTQSLISGKGSQSQSSNKYTFTYKKSY